MMKLIADSGSTKTTWALTNTESGQFTALNTIGYNPYFIDTEGIADSLKKRLATSNRQSTNSRNILLWRGLLYRIKTANSKRCFNYSIS